MTAEFDRVLAVCGASLAGRAIDAAVIAAEAAWRSSTVVSVLRSKLTGHPPTVVVRTAAIVIAVAAALQPLLIQMMPATARPAMPAAAYVVVAVMAAGIAIKSRDVVSAWPASWLSRRLR
jgi:hypothetical protein